MDDYLKSKTSIFDMVIGAVFIFLAFFFDDIAIHIWKWEWMWDVFGIFDLILLFIGIILIFYGLENWRRFIVPVGISSSFLALAYIPVLFESQIHRPFAAFTTSAANSVLNLLGYSASSVGTTITLYASRGTYSARIGTGCSGMNSVFYFSIVGGFLISKIKAEVWKRVLIIVIGAIGLVFINILRVTILCMTYYHWGYTMMQTFHSHLGDLMFIGWIAFIWWLGFKYVFSED